MGSSRTILEPNCHDGNFGIKPVKKTKLQKKTLGNPKGLFICSFPPFADERSRILILGSMPGPEALRKQEYYGFGPNAFWHLIPALLEVPPPKTYPEKIALLKEHRIALWDTIQSCTRVGAGDHTIRQIKPNDIIGLIKKYPGIRAIFLNGRTAEKQYRKYFSDKLHIPSFYLPSTSPANAKGGLKAKLKAWSLIKRYLENQNPWC